LNGDYQKAKEIYLKWKDEPFELDKNYRTYKDVFLADIKDLKDSGIQNKYFKKAEELLKE
jgi:hypothetical protein